MYKSISLLSLFLFGAVFLQAEGTSNYTPESRTSSETFSSKVLKVYSFQDGDFEYAAYLVNWKDHEVVVTPLGSVATSAKYNVGDTIHCTMLQTSRRAGDTNKSRISFYIASGGVGLEDAQRLEAISAEVKERREKRQAVIQDLGTQPKSP
jgi:hypothetical protein